MGNVASTTLLTIQTLLPSILKKSNSSWKHTLVPLELTEARKCQSMSVKKTLPPCHMQNKQLASNTFFQFFPFTV